MKAPYMGLAVPLFPDSLSDGIQIEPSGSAGSFDILTITQSSGHSGDFLVLEERDGSTEILVVEEDGVTNWVVASPGADNVLAVVVTDTSTVTSGYIQGVYVSLTLTSDASYTTGSAQINGFAVDLFLDGTVGCEAEGMYVYVASNSAPTLTSSNINGINVYIDDLKATPGNRSALQLHIADGNAASGQDAFIVCRLEGASGAVTNFLQFAGTATLPSYFMATNSGSGTKMIQAITVGGTQDKVLACNINGSTYWIPLYAASA